MDGGSWQGTVHEVTKSNSEQCGHNWATKHTEEEVKEAEGQDPM